MGLQGQGGQLSKRSVVVLGWGQLPVIDCGSTFAPVCRLQSIRMVLAIAAENNLECWRLDYNTAFLNADVTEEVYVKMAPGYEKFDKIGVPLVRSLSKSLYGFSQTPTNGGTRSTNIWRKLASNV